MWLGFDDTDSRFGGCTTFVCYELIHTLLKNGYSVIGYPRLIRLNPMVPWKTRGNGAVAFEIGNGVGQKVCFGKKEDYDFFMYPNSDGKKIPIDDLVPLVEPVIEKYAQVDVDNTNPAYVISDKPLSYDMYDQAAKKIVNKDDVIEELEKIDSFFKLYKNGRGVIGASAAIAWDSYKDNTYELISYRRKNRWGTKRNIGKESVKKMDHAFPLTFNNFDYENNHNSIAPNSPCPILYGIRSEDDKILQACKKMVQSEEMQGWMIYISNQGTDDHLQKKMISDITAFESVVIKGVVSQNPLRNIGGHVIFSITDEKNDSIDCAAYEPTKGFRDIIEELHCGDVVEVFGGIREKPFTVNIEKIRVYKLVDVFEKVENPVCPVCKKHMKSRGKDQGYQCKKCKTSSKDAVMQKKQRSIKTSFYEVPVCARRHLSKPLKRIKKKE